MPVWLTLHICINYMYTHIYLSMVATNVGL